MDLFTSSNVQLRLIMTLKKNIKIENISELKRQEWKIKKRKVILEKKKGKKNL
jgi:hypothetical protein